MALLLTKKKQRNTLKKYLNGYMRSVMITAILLLFSFSFLHLVSVQQYQENMNEVLILNEFFNELDRNYRLLKQYIDSREAIKREELEVSNIQLQEKEQRLKRLRVNRRFSRDIVDFSALLGHYTDQNSLIRQTIGKENADASLTQTTEETVTSYEQAGVTYELMVAQYKDLHSTLINAVNEAQKKLNNRTLFCYLTLIGVMIFFTVASVRRSQLLTNQIVDPLQILGSAAECVRRGESERFEDVEIHSDAYEEIISLATAFNMMVRQLQKHILVVEENARNAEKLHRQEIENMRIISCLRASELKALQMQMNPHFLFNTLNIISRTADLGDTELTVLLLQKTAQLLRYNLDYSGKTVTLAKEIEMLGNYVFLQEQRFRNRIVFDFELDERFHQIQVPCFILQPLIENAVIHGLGNHVGKGRICICTKYIDEVHEGQISITDNGAGMTREVLDHVYSNLNSDQEQREKIGLANINMRLKLLFEDSYLLEIISSPGKGTQIRIRITIE